jgi:hypothetical protein
MRYIRACSLLIDLTVMAKNSSTSRRVAKSSQSDALHQKAGKNMKASKIVSLHQVRSGRPHRGIHQIGLGHLLDFLSEMLVLQKNCIRLMTLARDRASTPEIHQFMEQFVDSTENRADQIRSVIRDLGGNPVFVSPAAQVQQQRVEAALQLAVPSRLQQLCDVENCWYAALQEEVHLAFLRSIVPYLDSVHARDRLGDLLDEIAHELNDRIEWLQQALHSVLLQRAVMPSDGNDWYRAA